MNYDEMVAKLELLAEEIEYSNDLAWLNKRLVFFNRMIGKFSDNDNPFCKFEVNKFTLFKEITEERIKQLEA
jgi:hypothetical protein